MLGCLHLARMRYPFLHYNCEGEPTRRQRKSQFLHVEMTAGLQRPTLSTQLRAYLDYIYIVTQTKSKERSTSLKIVYLLSINLYSFVASKTSNKLQTQMVANVLLSICQCYKTLSDKPILTPNWKYHLLCIELRYSWQTQKSLNSCLTYLINYYFQGLRTSALQTKAVYSSCGIFQFETVVFS